MRKTFVFFALLGVSATASADADRDYCQIVLTNKAFDTTSLVTSEKIMSDTQHNLCNKQYSSEEEARKEVSAAGFGLSYAGIGVSASNSDDTGSSKKSIASSDFCKADVAKLRSAYQSSYQSQVASVAVNAWERCRANSKDDDLFLRYQINNGGLTWVGDIWHKTGFFSQKDVAVVGMTIYGDSQALEWCKIAGQEITIDSLKNKPLRLEQGKTSLVCQKRDADKSVGVHFQLSNASLPPIDLPSTAIVDASRVDKLEAALEAERVRAQEQAAALVAERAKLAADVQTAHTQLTALGTTVSAAGQATTALTNRLSAVESNAVMKGASVTIHNEIDWGLCLALKQMDGWHAGFLHPCQALSVNWKIH